MNFLMSLRKIRQAEKQLENAKIFDLKGVIYVYGKRRIEYT